MRLQHFISMTGYAFTVVLLSLLSACSFVPAPSPSPVSIPETFRASGSAPPAERWWMSLGDADLNGLVEQALAGNLTLSGAWDRLDQARATARKAGAELWPTLTAEGGVARSWQEVSGVSSGTTSYSAGLVAGYELDLWGRVRAGRAAAGLEAEASAEDVQVAAITLAAEVADTWYRLVEQRGQHALLESQLETNLKVLTLLELQFRTGRIGIVDVLQQRQLVESKRGELHAAAALLEVLENTLAVLLGEPPGVALPLRQVFPELPPLPATGVPAELLERRPDVRRAWLRMRAADQRVAGAVAARFPQLSLGGRLEDSAPNAGALFDDWIKNLGANLALPLIDGGQRRAEVERTRGAAAEALHGYGQVLLEALAEVENALVQEARQRELLTSLDLQVGYAEESVARIRDRYLNGAADYERVLAALLSYQNLQLHALSARRELLGYRIALCRGLAGGWELPRPGTGE